MRTRCMICRMHANLQIGIHSVDPQIALHRLHKFYNRAEQTYYYCTDNTCSSLYFVETSYFKGGKTNSEIFCPGGVGSNMSWTSPTCCTLNDSFRLLVRCSAFSFSACHAFCSFWLASWILSAAKWSSASNPRASRERPTTCDSCPCNSSTSACNWKVRTVQNQEEFHSVISHVYKTQSRKHKAVNTWCFPRSVWTLVRFEPRSVLPVLCSRSLIQLSSSSTLCINWYSWRELSSCWRR